MRKIYTCAICGKQGESNIVSKRLSMYLCNKHYAQMRKHNEIVDASQRTTHEQNEIIQKGDYAEVVLRDKQNKITGIAKIDIDDIDRVAEHKWCEFHGYAIARDKYIRIFMHRFIMNYHDELDVDHINMNRLDNRKCNLRIVSREVNSKNKNNDTKPNTKNIYKYGDKWIVKMQRNGKKFYKDSIHTYDEAVEIRNIAEGILGT